MKHFQKSKTISPEEYRAFLNTISDGGINFINDSIESLMPDQMTVGTLYSIVLHIAAKTICGICQYDKVARKSASDFFCEQLPKLVEQALVLPNSSISKNEH